MDDPDDLVERVPVDGVARVGRLEHRRHRLAQVEVDREPGDVGARDHHVGDLLLGEVEDLVEHLALVQLDLAVRCRDLEQHLQLRLGVRRALHRPRVDPDRALRELARPLQHPDQRLEDEEEQPHRPGDAERDPLRVAQRDAFRHELPDDDVEERDDEEREEHGQHRREPFVEELGEHALAQGADAQRGERDAELHRGDEVRRVARDPQDRAGRAAALVGKLPHARPPDRDERVLACDEERVEQDQENDPEQFEPDGHLAGSSEGAQRRVDATRRVDREC